MYHPSWNGDDQRISRHFRQEILVSSTPTNPFGISIDPQVQPSNFASSHAHTQHIYIYTYIHICIYIYIYIHLYTYIYICDPLGIVIDENITKSLHKESGEYRLIREGFRASAGHL